MTNCPLRDDTIEKPDALREEILANAALTYEGFFVSPRVIGLEQEREEHQHKED